MINVTALPFACSSTPSAGIATPGFEVQLPSAAVCSSRLKRPSAKGEFLVIPARTAVLTLQAPQEAVFKLLADVENLPRWAPEFCESVFIVNGRWMALTSCGELYLELGADAVNGEVALSAGGEAANLHRFVFELRPSEDESSTRLRFRLEAGRSEEKARLFTALEHQLRGVIERRSHLFERVG